MRRTAAAGALALVAALLTGCDGGAAKSAAGTPVARPSSPTRSATSPEALPTTSTPPRPDDPALDPALSSPVEDSVYPDVGDPSVDALHYGLDLSWSPDTSLLDADATIELRATTTGDHLQLDLDAPLHVSTVTLDGAAVPFDHTGKDLVVHAAVTKDQRYVLDVRYSGTPQPTPAPTTRSDFSTSGWTTTTTGEVWTMQEPYGAFTWYPVNDQPSDKAFYDLTVTAPAPMVAVANGVMTGQTTTGGLTTTSWHLDEPASSYVVTVAIGDYTRTSNTASDSTEIDYWVPSDQPQVATALTSAADWLDWLESKLGPYPFHSLGFLVVDSQSGMETQTMITLGQSSYDLSPAVQVHEMAHQWYGDEVTPADWSDVWMNEGMAMFLQGAWQAQHDGVPLESVMDGYARAERPARKQDGPPAAYDPSTFGENNIYFGPALMWDELRKKIGDDAFWATVRAWPAHDPETSVTRADYLDWLVRQTGVPRSFFQDWLLSPTTPPRSAS